MDAEQLADLIESNPNCRFDIDNDAWYMTDPTKNPGEDGDDNQIATDSDFSFETDWYGHSGNYGFGISEALVILLNRRGFKIKAGAV